MKAFIFAAGKGTRLGELTQSVPKALVEVGGRPMLGHVFDKVKGLGVSDVTVNVHWLGNQIVDYLKGTSVKIQDEEALLLDTGGSLARYRREHPSCDEPLLAHNCDILSKISLEEMAQQHQLTGADVTLCVHDRPTKRRLQFDAEGRFLGRADGEGPGAFAFDGIHILSPRALDAVAAWRRANEPFSITDFYASHAAELNIRAFIPAAPVVWVDAGRPDTLATARALFSE